MKQIKILISDEKETVEITGKAHDVYIQKSFLFNEMGVAINLTDVKKEKIRRLGKK
ncbi:MAG: hypothetical protein GX180_08825 [Enterococcus sp.]|nr:hypothetical protein [Enterococcus sp.]